MSRLCIYPGSFDPLTNGHLSLIQRGLKIFDSLVVAVANNPDKLPLFSVEERMALIREALGSEPRVEVDGFEGLLVDYAKRRGIHTVLRGLRAVSDFEYEFQLANMNRKLDPDFDSVFVMTGEDYFFVSAKLVREVASYGGRLPDRAEELRRLPGVGRYTAGAVMSFAHHRDAPGGGTAMTNSDRVKVTLKLPVGLVKQAKHYGIDHGIDLQDLVADALRALLARKGAR